MYNDIVMKRFESPKFSGSLKNANAKASVASQECGDEIEFQLFVKDDLIRDIRFKTYGCAAAIASADMLAEMAHEKSLAEAKRISADFVVQKLKGLPEVKLPSVDLAVKALRAAIKDYETRAKKK